MNEGEWWWGEMGGERGREGIGTGFVSGIVSFARHFGFDPWLRPLYMLALPVRRDQRAKTYQRRAGAACRLNTQLRAPLERSDDVTIAADRRMTGTPEPLRGSREPRMTRLVARRALVAGVLAWLLGRRGRSPGALDPVLITAITLDTAQQQQVRDFAGPLGDGLKSNDQKQIQAGTGGDLGADGQRRGSRCSFARR